MTMSNVGHLQQFYNVYKLRQLDKEAKKDWGLYACYDYKQEGP